MKHYDSRPRHQAEAFTMNPYEQSITTITGVFAVLIGFALQKLLDNTSFGPHLPLPDRWPYFLLSVLLFLRFLLGSANHLKYTYVDRYPPPQRYNHPIRDFAFLTLFGLLAIVICYQTDINAYFAWTWIFLLAAWAWTFLHLTYRGAGGNLAQLWKGPWAFWFWINLVQLLVTVVVEYSYVHRILDTLWLPPFHWSGSVSGLLVIYAVCLWWDFFEQLKVLKSPRGAS